MLANRAQGTFIILTFSRSFFSFSFSFFDNILGPPSSASSSSAAAAGAGEGADASSIFSAWADAGAEYDARRQITA